MDTLTFLRDLVGNWDGRYRLWLDPTGEPEVSATAAEIRHVAAGKYVLFTYIWSRNGNPQEGVFLVGGDGNSAWATWGDSWHMSPEPMVCNGLLADDASQLVLDGHYAAGDQQWGWRTEFLRQDAGTLVMQAFNVTPDGDAALAVRAEFHREQR